MVLVAGWPAAAAMAQEASSLPIPTLGEGLVKAAKTPEEVATTLEIVFLLTILTLAPSIMIMTTAFTRIVIVLGFLRRALSTQEMPPNQVVVGLSLILTFLIMSPTWTRVNREAMTPYLDGDISQRAAFEIGSGHLREFMFGQMRRPDELRLMYDVSGRELPTTKDDVGSEVLMAAFVLSELKKAFQMGFMLFLPFLVIDIVIASILISMGMLVLPPILISLPIKICVFVLVDGWALVVGELVRSFY